MKVSPLGRYSAIVTAFVLVGVIAADILARLAGNPDSFLDMLALTAFGLIAGTAGALTQMNGTVKRTQGQDDELIALRALVAQQSASKREAPGP